MKIIMAAMLPTMAGSPKALSEMSRNAVHTAVINMAGNSVIQ